MCLAEREREEQLIDDCNYQLQLECQDAIRKKMHKLGVKDNMVPVEFRPEGGYSGVYLNQEPWCTLIKAVSEALLPEWGPCYPGETMWERKVMKWINQAVHNIFGLQKKKVSDINSRTACQTFSLLIARLLVHTEW